ncbi:LADA_0H02146g1_1 [Lachancea dasiensis]|uniref:SUN-like protein 1 n=1 Tax=Lachancea dasiensis TaxID=1072105 RepID=A0A1G4JZL5_9SACH|nr:LADA_0H02146g1_1 [Lachancea dasiensis]
MESFFWLFRAIAFLNIAACSESALTSPSFDVASDISATAETFNTNYFLPTGFNDSESRCSGIHNGTSRLPEEMTVAQKTDNLSGNLTLGETIIIDKDKYTVSSSSKLIPSSSLVQTIASSSTKIDSSEIDLNDTDPTFLSFDEWKKVKLDQESSRDSKLRAHATAREDLSFYRGDALGDDLEIDLGLFTSQKGALNEEPEGKLYLDKFNYASLDCAATIVKTNSEASGANAILHENKDKYLLTPCSAPMKFVVMELCQDILVEEIAIANYEFFSSTFKRLRFSVSDRFPPKSGWKVLGEFDANNTRNIQKFEISKSLIWARYLRIEVLSHYGSEFYCPISLVRVHGKTMIDDFKLDETNDIYSSRQEGSHAIKSEECVHDEQEGLSYDGKYLDTCEFPRFRPSHIMAGFPVLDFAGDQCPAILPHLEVDQFLKTLNQTSCESVRFQPLETPGSLPSSSAEESIFKTIIKRLSLLESNSTLSLRYIEEQSKLLSRAFSNLEKNQAKKFDTLVSALNQTILSNLGDIQVFSQQLRESSLKLLEEQRFSNEQFTADTLLRLEGVQKDAVFQQRLSYTMLFAFTTLLMYVLLTKEIYVDGNMEDDGWYLKSPPLKKAKEKLWKKAGMESMSNGPLIFEMNHEGSEHEYRSDLSASTSSTSLYDDFATGSNKQDERPASPVHTT